MKICFVMKPLNHDRWKLIYLLVILITLTCAPHGKANDSIRVNRPVIVKYQNKVIDNYVQYLWMRRVIYGEGQKKKKASRLVEISEPKPSPHQAGFEIQGRRRGNRQQRFKPALASAKASSRLAYALWRQDAGRSYRASPQAPQSKRRLRRTNNSLSLRGTT